MAAACPFPTSQGSQVLIKSVSEALSRIGHDVRIISYHNGEPHIGFDLPIHRIPNVPTYRNLRAGPALQKPLLDLMLAIRLYQVVLRYGIDIIHAHNYEALIAGLMVRRLKGTPVLFHSHSALTKELHLFFSSRVVKAITKTTAGAIDAWIPVEADGCLALSPEDVAFYISKGVHSERIHMVPPPYFEEEFKTTSHPEPGTPDTVKQSPTVIYTGNLDPYQDLELLFFAFNEVLKTITDAKLIILSHCKPEPYRSLAERLGFSEHCSFIPENGFQTTLAWLARSHVAVCTRTSTSGFPIKLLNYMGTGCPIVTSQGSAKGIKHLHDGYIVRNPDPLEMGRAIVTLIKDRRLARRLGSNARRTVQERYHWVKIAGEIEKMYERIL